MTEKEEDISRVARRTYELWRSYFNNAGTLTQGKVLQMISNEIRMLLPSGELEKEGKTSENNCNIADVVCSLPIKVGTLIAEERNINNYPEKDGYKFKNIYYQLCNGRFELTIDDGSAVFEGKYLRCLGSDYWHNLKGEISGLELIDCGSFKIIDEMPNGLF